MLWSQMNSLKWIGLNSHGTIYYNYNLCGESTNVQYSMRIINRKYHHQKPKNNHGK